MGAIIHFRRELKFKIWRITVVWGITIQGYEFLYLDNNKRQEQSTYLTFKITTQAYNPNNLSPIQPQFCHNMVVIL